MASSSITRPPPLPGYGEPLSFVPDGATPFTTALTPEIGDRDSSERMPLITLRESAMLQFQNRITDKPEWQTKVLDETITQKWKSEILEQSDVDFTQEMADYCIEELKYKAELYKTKGFVIVLSGDVIKSDDAIPSEIKEALKSTVAPLENVPPKRQDWHPGSNGMVLDLVHPSLFPLIYGRSRILETETIDLENCLSSCGQGVVIPTLSAGSNEWDQNPYSEKFQWLPCDVDIRGETSKIVSYINNLHPHDHKDVYGVLEKIIDRVIPLWNATLGPVRELDWPRRIQYGPEVDYGGFDIDSVEDSEGPVQRDNESESDYYDRLNEWRHEVKGRELIRPNPEPFSPPDEQVEVDLKKEYSQTGLQIIVKLANIHLTPEKPEYAGGSWHVEGQMNEHIIATAIYYFDNENITPSHLAFRQASGNSDVEEENGYAQEDSTWLKFIYGLERDGPCVQNIGSVQSKENRLITFPNILQHQVQSFKLEDPTKPGHRKILALFLVDPEIKIISTANIPCQQREWWARNVKDTLDRLPLELKDRVIDEVEDFPIGMDEAKRLREELMEERKLYVIDYQHSLFEEATISLCEH